MASREDIPAVAAQPTERGQTIRLVAPVGTASVIPGHGDWETNTGEIDVLAVAPDGAVTTLLPAFDTEAIATATVIDGAVWIPSTDPLDAHPASLATNHGGEWHTVPVTVDGLPVAEHLFAVTPDPATGDLLGCGAHLPDTAFVWRSTDTGATWTEDLAVPSGIADGLNRFLEFRLLDGKVAVQRAGIEHYVLNGGVWVQHLGYGDFEPLPEWSLTFTEGGLTRVLTPGGTVVASFSDSAPVTVIVANDGALWWSDGESIWRLPDPD